ncbi:MAG: hypothetical protein KJZ47_11670, partial [Gemmatimonadales bacterium]|nr:hypothetical protein [Gemmatimonadales bacterium]
MSSRSWIQRGLGLAAAGFLLLAIPGPEPEVAPAPASGAPFIWGADSLWQRLDHQFVQATSAGCGTTLPLAEGELASLTTALADRPEGSLAPVDPFLDSLELRFFELAPAVGAGGGPHPPDKRATHTHPTQGSDPPRALASAQ